MEPEKKDVSVWREEGDLAEKGLNFMISVVLPYLHFWKEKNDQCLSYSKVYDQVNIAWEPALSGELTTHKKAKYQLPLEK